MTPYIADQPMLARRQVRLAAVAALQAISGLNVQSPGDWATPPEKLPAALVRVTADRKENVTKHVPEFTTTVTLEVQIRLQALTEAAAQDALESLGYQAEQALFTNYALVAMCQQLGSTVDTDVEITAEGAQHIAAQTMRIECEVFEAFDATVTPPAASTWPVQAVPTVPLDSVGIHLDMAAPFDPNGTYTPSTDAPAYTPTTPPRTSGPDGRDEASLDINLPQ